MFGDRGGVTVSVQLNPVQYHDFLMLAGNGIKASSNGLGAKDYLSALVAGQGPPTAQRAWNKATPEARAIEVRHIMSESQNAARMKLLHDHPELAETVMEGLKARAAALSGRPAR